MDFNEMSEAYDRARRDRYNKEKIEYFANYRNPSSDSSTPIKPTIYDHIIVECSGGGWAICRTNANSLMLHYQEICRCAYKHEAEDIAHLLNKREGQK